MFCPWSDQQKDKCRQCNNNGRLLLHGKRNITCIKWQVSSLNPDSVANGRPVSTTLVPTEAKNTTLTAEKTATLRAPRSLSHKISSDGRLLANTHASSDCCFREIKVISEVVTHRCFYSLISQLMGGLAWRIINVIWLPWVGQLCYLKHVNECRHSLSMTENHISVIPCLFQRNFKEPIVN